MGLCLLKNSDAVSAEKMLMCYLMFHGKHYTSNTIIGIKP